MTNIIAKGKKFIFKKFFLASTNRNFISLPAQKVAMKPMKTDFLLLTIVFNDPELIKLQYHSLKKIEDAYDYMVVDDSSSSEKITAIESFCAENDISYIHLPANRPGLDGSLYHAMALNWAFYNVIKKLKPERFGFLDPDLFVARPDSFLKPWDGKEFWGMKGPSVDPNLWRLWPGFAFFSRDFYEHNDLNFLPIKNLDTGGSNYALLKNKDTSHLIPWSDVKNVAISDDVKETYQAFANIIHLVGGVSLRSTNTASINRKREFAYNLVFGSAQADGNLLDVVKSSVPTNDKN